MLNLVDVVSKDDIIIDMEGESNKLDENPLSDTDILEYSSISKAISIPSRQSEVSVIYMIM